MNRCVPSKAGFAPLRLGCAAQRSRARPLSSGCARNSNCPYAASAQFGDQCGDLRGRSQSSRSSVKSRVASKLFCLKSSVRCLIRLRSAHARLGRPWPELGGMADQAALGRRGRAAQFRARLGRRARFLIAVHCCARWLHARMRAHSVCKQTLREPRMSRPARALISALSRTPRASLGTLSSRPKTLGRLKDVCAS